MAIWFSINDYGLYLRPRAERWQRDRVDSPTTSVKMVRMENQIVSKYFSHKDFTPDLAQALERIAKEHGFSLILHAHRRQIYDKLWRVRIEGMWQGKQAMLRVENLKLETDEETIRQAFRAQCRGTKVRPPETYLSKPFDQGLGYAFSIEELVEGQPLFDPSGDPQQACAAFAPFYRELRRATVKPFWDTPGQTTREYSIAQMAKWHELADRKYPEHTAKVDKLVSRLRTASMETRDNDLRFMHAHLSGADVRVAENGEWVVFANHYWRWSQPGYDIAFPLWGMWLALPTDKLMAEDVQHITDTWMAMVRDELDGLVTTDELKFMILNRLYGSLLLDLPAKMNLSNAELKRLEWALISEAERLLAAP